MKINAKNAMNPVKTVIVMMSVFLAYLDYIFMKISAWHNKIVHLLLFQMMIERAKSVAQNARAASVRETKNAEVAKKDFLWTKVAHA